VTDHPEVRRRYRSGRQRFDRPSVAWARTAACGGTISTRRPSEIAVPWRNCLPH